MGQISFTRHVDLLNDRSIDLIQFCLRAMGIVVPEANNIQCRRCDQLVVVIRFDDLTESIGQGNVLTQCFPDTLHAKVPDNKP